MFYFYLSKKTRLEFSRESSADSLETSSLIFSENNEKYLRMSFAAVVIGALRVKKWFNNLKYFYKFILCCPLCEFDSRWRRKSYEPQTKSVSLSPFQWLDTTEKL